MLSFALMSILNVAACKVSKHGIDFIVIIPFVILPFGILRASFTFRGFFAYFATKHSE